MRTMGFMGLFGITAKKAAEGAEGGLIMLLEKMNLGDINDEHQLQQHENTLESVSVMMVKAENDYKREKSEYDAIQKQYNDLMADAEKINDSVTVNSNLITVEMKAKLEAHLAKLLDEIEAMKPKVEKEKTEMDQAKEHFDMVAELVKTKAKGLAEARERLKAARTENQHLEAELQTVKDREQQQKILMGIREEVSSMDTVLNAVGSESKAKRDKIDAANARINALKAAAPTASTPIDEDVAAFLNKGGEEKSQKSLSDRLAALKK